MSKKSKLIELGKGVFVRPNQVAAIDNYSVTSGHLETIVILKNGKEIRLRATPKDVREKLSK